MPMATPPWIWPETSCGTISVPHSWREWWPVTLTTPVAVSTTTSAIAAMPV